MWVWDGLCPNEPPPTKPSHELTAKAARLFWEVTPSHCCEALPNYLNMLNPMCIPTSNRLPLFLYPIPNPNIPTPPPQAISVPVLPRKVFSKSLVFLKLVWWFFSWKIVSYAIWLYVILVAGPTWDVCLKHIWSFLLIFSMISIIENMGVQWFLFPTISLLQLHETLDYYKMVTKSTLMHLSPTYLFLSNIATIFNRFDTISIIKHP